MTEHPWTGSIPGSAADIVANDVPQGGFIGIVPVCFLIGLALVVLVFYAGYVTKIQDGKSTHIAFWLLVPFYVLFFTGCGVSSLGYWWTLCVLVAFFVFRHLALLAIGWIMNCREAAQSAIGLGRTLWVYVIALSLAAPLAAYLFPGLPLGALRIYAAAVTAVGFLFYAVKINEIFRASGFSFFSTFLYLCALEILPICIAVDCMI